MAAAFDLILSEYSGYTDETILDLTLDRIRQMVSVISERKRFEEEMRRAGDLQIAELVTKTLGGLLANLASNSKTGRAMIAAVKRIDFLKALRGRERKEEKELPSTESVLSRFGVDDLGAVGRR